MALRYTPISAELLLQSDDHLVFQAVYEHVASLLGDAWFPTSNVNHLEGLTDHVKTVWQLWWFAAEVAGNGMSAWVLNCAPHAAEIIESREALGKVGASDLRRLLEAGIGLAVQLDADFLNQPDARELLKLGVESSHREFGPIDDKSMTLAAGPLSSLIASYVRANLSQF